MGAVGRFTKRALVASAALAAAAAASGPLWACGRPDRAWGFALGAAASLIRFAWSVHLAHGLERSRPSRYAASRTAGLLPLAAALVIAGTVERIDLVSTVAGVFLATAAALIASAFELRGPTSFAEATEAGRAYSADATLRSSSLRSTRAAASAAKAGSLGEGRPPAEEIR